MKIKLITILFAIMILCVGGVYDLSSSPVSAAENNEIVFDTSSVQPRVAVGDKTEIPSDIISYVGVDAGTVIPSTFKAYWVVYVVQLGVPTFSTVDFSSFGDFGRYTYLGYRAYLDGSLWDNSVFRADYIQKKQYSFEVLFQKQTQYYTVTFNLNGGIRTGGGALTQTIEEGKSATAPTCTREGYRFDGWDKSFNYVTSNLTVNALWTELPKYTVTFDLGAYGQRTGGGALVQTVVQGGSAVAPTVSSINGFITFDGWDKSFSNIQSNLTVNAKYSSLVEFHVTFADNVFVEIPNPVYDSPVFIYSRGFFSYINGNYLTFNYPYKGQNGLEVSRFLVELYDYENGERSSFEINGADLYNFSTWQDNLIPHYSGGDLLFTAIYEDFNVSFKYITGVNFNELDGSVSNYDYETKTFVVKGETTLSQDLYYSFFGDSTGNLQDFTGAYFSYWTLDGKEQPLDAIFDRVVISDIFYEGFYSPRLFNVTFWNQFEKLGSASYHGGIGAIKPPNFTFSFGTRLVGWSLELNGAYVDLTKYPLTGDIDLYALTNFTSSPGDVSFDIPYNECQWYDIGCHLGNFFFWFLNECPLVSDIVKLVVPFGQLFNIFVDNIILFDSLGWIFGVSIGLLFVFFIFKVFN